MTELIGRIFDRKYRVTRLIGEGGMGSVYEAEHTLIQRKVAVKVLHNEFSKMPEVVERFFREAQASSAIGHPNIIEVFDVGIEEDGTVFIVMELLTGEPLLEQLRRGEILTPENAVAIILQVLSALVMAHHKGIVHRDLKPDNVFLSVDARGRHEVKLLDFGIAKVQGALDGDQGLTKTGTVLGTPNYMSPEQARGREVDARIDIWAAGVMLYQMLSGRLPYQGESYNEVLSSILLDDPPPLHQLVPSIPRDLATVVERAMEKERDDRYPNVAEMIQDLIPFNDEAAQELMSDTAALALKQSLAPPPPMSEQDTLLATHEALSSAMRSRGGVMTPRQSVMTPRQQAIQPGLGGISTPGFGQTPQSGRLPMPSPSPLGLSGSPAMGFPPGSVHQAGETPYSPQERRSPLWGILLTIVLLAGAVVGAVFVNKGENQTFTESGESLYGRVATLWQGTVEELPPAPALSDFTAALSEDKGESTDSAADAPSEAEVAAEAEPADAEALPEEVTITLKGLPKRAQVTLDGKKVDSPIKVPGGRKPMVLKVTSKRHKTLRQEIVPDSDKILDFSPEKKSSGKRTPRSKKATKSKKHKK